MMPSPGPATAGAIANDNTDCHEKISILQSSHLAEHLSKLYTSKAKAYTDHTTGIPLRICLPRIREPWL
jgi:hypothetical protein